MNEQALWGLLLVVYIVPFWMWQVSEHGKIDARRKLYPGRPDEKELERRLNSRSLLWVGGLAATLGAWSAGWHPIGTAIVMVAVAVSVFVVSASIRRWQLLRNRLFRFWVVGSVVWVLAIAAWYLVFGRTSDLDEQEFIMLALLPTIVSSVALVGWHWAARKA